MSKITGFRSTVAKSTNNADFTNNSFTRSKSVYKEQDWMRNGTSGSRSTASHSSGLPAFKKNSSISADYGNSYHQKIASNSGRRALGNSTLKGSSLNNDYHRQSRGESNSEVAYPQSNQITNRPPSQRLNSLGRANSSTRSSQQKLPTGPVEHIGPDSTVIHVIDENKNKQKDFKCSLPILLKHMKYFEKHLKASESTDDIDISVHCDVLIFEWLLNYIEKEEQKVTNNDTIKFYDVVTKEGDSYKAVPTNKRRKPNFEIGNAISILISSDYLRMSGLVDECLDFFIQNINDILRLPIDMSCISAPLQRKIAVKMSEEDLDQVKDKKDKLISKLYMNKLHIMLEEESKTLYKCSYCSKLFTQKQQEKFGCPKAKIFVDFHGKVIAKHMFDRTFDVKKFISFCKNTMKFSWKQIFWKLYAHTLDFECKTCGKRFNGAYAKHCYYHPAKAMFSFGSNKGTYQCCKQETLRFDFSEKNDGCLTQDHLPKKNEEMFTKLLESSRVECTQEPYTEKIQNNNNDLIDENGQEVQNSEPKLEFVSIIEAVKKYNKEVDSNWMLEEEDEDDIQVEVPRASSFSPLRNRSSSLRKQKSNSPLRLKNNSRTENAGANPSMSQHSTSNIVDPKPVLEEKKEEEASKEPQSAQNLENLNTSGPVLANDKTTNNTSTDNIAAPAPKAPKSPSKKRRKNKQNRSISNAPSFLCNNKKAMKDFVRDNRRDEDRKNMSFLMDELKRARRDENSKKGTFKFNTRNTRIIKKKDIKVQNKRGIGPGLIQSKRKIIGSQGVINKSNYNK